MKILSKVKADKLIHWITTKALPFLTLEGLKKLHEALGKYIEKREEKLEARK